VVEDAARAPLHQLPRRPRLVQHGAPAEVQARVDVDDEDLLALRFPAVVLGLDCEVGSVLDDECQVVEVMHAVAPQLGEQLGHVLRGAGLEHGPCSGSPSQSEVASRGNTEAYSRRHAIDVRAQLGARGVRREQRDCDDDEAKRGRESKPQQVRPQPGEPRLHRRWWSKELGIGEEAWKDRKKK
jgi:hypothetical protein